MRIRVRSQPPKHAAARELRQHARAEIGRLRVWEVSGAVRRQPGSEGGRGGRRDRSERRRQDHADAGDLRPDPADQGGDINGRHRCAGDTGASHRQPRHRPCAGKSPAVSAAHRRRQSAYGRVHAGRPRQICRSAGIRVRSVSPHEGTPRPDGRDHVGRRAADVRDRPRADVEPEIAAARRALRRSGTGRGAAGVRTGEADSLERAHGPDRRAERAAGAAGGRSRLSARSGKPSRLRHVGGDDEQRHHQASISGRITYEEIGSNGDGKRDFAPSPVWGGGWGGGCLRESHCPCGESFPHPHRIMRCDATSPASGRGEKNPGRVKMQAFLDIFDIYLLEAVVNGILLGGVLALLALGLNLIFGVIDVTWICYAELVMIGMYGMYYLVQYFGLSYFVAAPLTILLVAGLGALLHLLVIAPLLTAPPINQLLATGGVLFVLQSFATVAFGIDFRNLGIRLPVLQFAEMHFSYSRLLAFGVALIGMVLVYLFMKRTFVGTAIRAISQDRQIMALMGVDARRIYLITSALGGALAGLASCLLVLQYDIHPFVGLSFGPITFLVCVLGGLGNFVGGFVAAFVFAEIISLGGLFSDLVWGYVLAFGFFIVMMFIRPAGLFARRS